MGQLGAACPHRNYGRPAGSNLYFKEVRVLAFSPQNSDCNPEFCNFFSQNLIIIIYFLLIIILISDYFFRIIYFFKLECLTILTLLYIYKKTSDVSLLALIRSVFTSTHVLNKGPQVSSMLVLR